MSETPPSLFRLVADGLVTKPTADALLHRLAPAVSLAPSFLDEEAFGVLVALSGRLRPRTFRPTAIELALRIDARLASGGGDGWRYDVMPPDGEAYTRGLGSLDAEALARYGSTFERLNGESQDAMIEAVQRGETHADWDLSATLFLADVLAEVVGHAYAQPCAQSAIGYVGFADAKGWVKVGLNEREDWES